MERKEIIESCLAAALGAISGITGSILLGVTWYLIIINTLLSAIVGFCLYQPKEIFSYIKDKITKKRSPNFNLEDLKKILQTIRVSLSFACAFIVVTFPFFILSIFLAQLLAPLPIINVEKTETFIILSYLFFIFLLPYALVYTYEYIKNNTSRSLLLPLSTLYLNLIINKGPLSYEAVNENNYESLEDFFEGSIKITHNGKIIRLHNMWHLAVATFMWWIFFIITMPFIILLIVDVILQIMALFANTFRLTSMTGAVIGFAIGTHSYLTNGSPVIGLFIGIGIAIISCSLLLLLKQTLDKAARWQVVSF